MEPLLIFLRESPVFALFVIIACGFMLGKIRVKGFSFDVSAVIFVALLFGHLGVKIPAGVQTMGLVLFIFTVGIQAGPGFMNSLKSKGKKYILLSTSVVVFSLLIALLIRYFLDVPQDMMTGIYCGALTSTPGLSVAIETTGSDIASIGYGMAYPLGVVGLIVFIKLIPKFMRVDPKEEFEKVKKRIPHKDHGVFHRSFRIENEFLKGKTIADVQIRTMTGATVSRIRKGETVITPKADTSLELGDVIRCVGSVESLEKAAILIGPEVEDLHELHNDYAIESLLVTNKSIVNQPLSRVLIQHGVNANVTRIRRSGIDFMPSSTTTLQFGDKITVAYHRSEEKALYLLIGNNAKVLSDTDFFPIALGIVLGVLLGKIHISLGSSFSVSLGLTGGVLVTALVLSNLGKTGPVLWTMTGSANNLLRQLGLLLFLAGVGSSAGASLVETIRQTGIFMLFVGLAITIVPMALTMILNRLFFHLNLFEMLGVISGGMTSTPALAATESFAYDETPSMIYATVYPVALIVLLIAIKIFAMT